MRVQLMPDELDAIRDHLNQVLTLDREIAQSQGQCNRERRDLEIAWKVACYRQAGQNGHEIGDVPPFISPEGKINVVLSEGGLATVSVPVGSVADEKAGNEDNSSGKE